MTESNNDTHNAYIALDAMRNPTRGAAPDWDELQSYRDGGLTASRREEVLSHIANNADVHQQWLDLAEAEHWLANPANQTSAANAANNRAQSTSWRERISDWLSPGKTVFGGAAAMAVAAVVLVPMMVQQGALTASQQFDMSAERYAALAAATPTEAPRALKTKNIGVGPLSAVQVEKDYVLVGLRSVVQETVQADSKEWVAWLANTAGELPNCDRAIDKDHCGAVAEDAQLLGQWTMLTWFGCRQLDSMPAGDEFWSSQTAMWNTLRANGSLVADGGVVTELTALDGTGTIELCDRAERLMHSMPPFLVSNPDQDNVWTRIRQIDCNTCTAML